MNNERQALALLDQIASQAPLVRADHQKVVSAVNALAAALDELEKFRHPAPEAKPAPED